MLDIRKVVVISEEIWLEGGRSDQGDPLRKVAALAGFRNPYAHQPYAESLDDLSEASGELASLLANRAVEALGGDVESYGKGAVVGLAGEQEHANACLTSVFGDSFREGIGGAKAWLPSVTKRAGAGASMDIPTCYKDAIWVRSHYDTITVAVPDAPLDDEILVGLAVMNRGRLNARLGGLRKEEAVGLDGVR